MATVFDVAKYILTKTGSLSTMKLQKLVYYVQAWSLVWDENPLFEEPIQAWANGPVVPSLFEAHKGSYKVGPEFFSQGKIKNLSANQRDTIDKVVDFYGDKNAQWLSDLTHSEDPWIVARRGLPEGERGSRVISWESMAEYYGSL